MFIKTIIGSAPMTENHHIRSLSDDSDFSEAIPELQRRGIAVAGPTRCAHDVAVRP